MKLQHRSYQKELLDQDNIPFADIERNMKELDTINTLLGGHAITVSGFRSLLGNRKNITVCEIGCGGGDNLAAIASWCLKREIALHCTGIDLKPECIEVARERPELAGISHWIAEDYTQVKLAQKPDIIFSSLFCHHFTNEELVPQLQWMQANTSTGFFINDLHRHPLAYRSISLLTKWFSSSYLVKNDAPLSVTRGFLKTEWQDIFRAAGISNVS
ncbi:MAG: methyltransferase domain-containing protein, partial [Chitinophagaceae bacterium]|nr:methyltransferase domain-containing protein [Chitinophagaceae bacterium]